MRIALDHVSAEPLSDQLSRALARRILRGSLAPGARLPTVRALAEELELAPNTVAKAYRMLERERLIETFGRRGSFVAERLPARPPGAETLLDESARAFVARARQLRAPDAAAMRAVRRAQAVTRLTSRPSPS